METKLITRTDAAAVQRILESNPDYSRRVKGAPSGIGAAEEALSALPPAVDIHQKVDLGLWEGPDLVAFADVIVGWPTDSTAHIGLLITHGARHGEGLGRAMHDAVIDYVSSHSAIQTLRLAIVDTNAEIAEPFWMKLGYEPTGEASRYASGDVESMSRIWARSLVAR
ncbi:MAG: GNAT family N-acetyltransferase [Propionibacteriaceae bacterium]|jgi:GNAT superfamily N-acetyltransferase|nr:GNAT family N-acetyltransferase [Propionibacteriaceae bacterium]